MRALTVVPGDPTSPALEEVPEPDPSQDSLLVETLLVGVCGTDREIAAGHYGASPRGRQRLIIGHEGLGRVLEAPKESEFRRGDLVVPIVRRPDPVPCGACAAGEWDMCRNGLYTERGIKELDGFCSARFELEPRFAVRLSPEFGRVGVLVEPASVLAKAWEHIERIGARASWAPRRVLVTGAGPIGLIAALFGRQRGLDVNVFDRVESGPKPELARGLGARYFSRSLADAGDDADIVIECTGAPQLVFDVMTATSPAGIVCLTGVSSGGRTLGVDVAALNRTMVLENDVVFGSVNANFRHYELAVAGLRRADPAWLEALITRRLPLERWQEAFLLQPGDVKTVLEFAS